MFYEVLSKVLRLLGHFITTDEEKSSDLTFSNTNQKSAKTFSEIQDKKFQFDLKKGFKTLKLKDLKQDIAALNLYCN